MENPNLNRIYNAGKFFEPKPEQATKEPISDETKPSNVKRKINVAKAFVPQQEDPFRQKVEAVMKGITEEPASAKAMAGKEEKPVPANAEVIDGTGQDGIGHHLAAGKSIYVKGDVGDATGESMSGFGAKIQIKGNAGKWTGHFMKGGEIHVEGNAGKWTGLDMSGGTLRIDGDVVSFAENALSLFNKGTIIWKTQTIWRKGQKVNPGWTNLNVKEKIAE
jgi:formylmethanofuran dehydrogenase subunit C